MRRLACVIDIGVINIILTTHVEIGICYLNIKHYKELGYDVKIGDKIIVPIEHLSPQSNIKVKVKCDVCGKEKNIKYQGYNNQVKNGGYYACSSKCAFDKNRKTMKERYEGGFNNKEIIEKRRKTCIEKYGKPNYANTNEFKEKYEKSMMDKYGVKNGFQSEEVKSKIKETNLRKYGTEHFLQNEDNKIQYLYGNKNPSYKHGQSYKDSIWGRSYSSKLFKRKVYAIKGKECICCSQTKRNTVIHHVYSRNTHPHLMYNINNVVVMCEECHMKFHNQYGYGNNTTLQFIEFLNNTSK